MVSPPSVDRSGLPGQRPPAYIKSFGQSGSGLRSRPRSRATATAANAGATLISTFARRANLPHSASLIPTPNQRQHPEHPVPQEGRFAVVTNVGCGMRWTLWRRADERRMRRTAKSCGPDAPTLASSFAEQSVNDGGKRARSPGRARRRPLKPLRREGRAFPVNLW
jgi:hypothetical protein